MLLHLTTAELLEYRRNLAGLEPVNLDFSIERTDGIDIDHIVAARLRNWYLGLLDSGPLPLLPVDDVAADAAVALGPVDGASAVTLPPDVRRCVDLRMEGWRATATVLPADRLDRVLRRQANPFTAATADYPVAVAAADSPRLVYVFPAGTSVLRARAVRDPGSGSFVLDEAALALLPTDQIFLDL